MSQRSQVAKSGSSPIEQCSAAWAAPGRSTAARPAASRASSGTVHQTAVVRSVRSGRSSGSSPSTSPDGLAAQQVGDDLVGHVDLAEREPARAPAPVRPARRRSRCRWSRGRWWSSRVGAADHRDVLVEVERLDEPGLAAVHVDRAGVGGGVRAAGVDGADHPAGLGLDQRDRRAAGRADVGEVAGPAPVGPEPAARAAPQQPGAGQLVDDVAGGRAEEGQVGLGERDLGGGGAQVRAEDVGVGRVEDGGLDRLAEQRLGVGDEVGVERVVAGDQHPERVAGAAAGAADLLPERRAGAGEAGHQHGVEAADVDAELEGVGGREAEQLAGAQLALELAALLGQVAAAVRRDARRQRGVDLAEQRGGGQRDLLGAAPRADEGQRPHVRRRPGRRAGRRSRRRRRGAAARRSRR